MCGYLGFFSNEKNISTLTEKVPSEYGADVIAIKNNEIRDQFKEIAKIVNNSR